VQGVAPVADRRDARRGPGGVAEDAVGRARGRQRVLGGADRAGCDHGPFDIGFLRVFGLSGLVQPEDFLGKPEPGRLAGAGGVVHARRGVGGDQRVDRRGDIAGPGRLAALVVDHRGGRARPGQPEHRLHEVAAVRAVQPGGADHVAGLWQRGPHGELACQLGAAVGAARGGAGALGVRGGRLTVEHVIGRGVDEHRARVRAGGGQAGSAAGVDGEGLVLVRLGGVDGGPGGAVDDHVRLRVADRRGHGRGVGYVQVGPGEGGEVLAPGRQQVDHVAAEHSGCAGD
jgi:hypothetical protein